MMPCAVNKQGKPFTWSYSAMSEFLTCPHKYAAKRFYCDVSEPPTVHTEWGTRVHLALEERVRDNKPLPDGMQQWEKWAVAIAGAAGEKHCERQISMTRGMELTDWFSKDAWCRGVVDVLILNGSKATLIDYKTGKLKRDDTQLVMFCGLVSLIYPEVETFNYKYIWLKEDTATGGTLSKDEALDRLTEPLRVAVQMEESWATENFPSHPCGLCRGWCPVESCIHWKEKRR